MEVRSTLGWQGFGNISGVIDTEGFRVVGGEGDEVWAELSLDEGCDFLLHRDDVAEVGLSNGWVMAAPHAEGDIDVATGVEDGFDRGTSEGERDSRGGSRASKAGAVKGIIRWGVAAPPFIGQANSGLKDTVLG